MPPLRLQEHLAGWLGAWPPAESIQVVGTPLRDQPGWDGAVHSVVGVGTPSVGTVLSVPPRWVSPVQELARTATFPDLLRQLPDLVGRPQARTYRGVFRWTMTPTDWPDAGEWFDASGPTVPAWLRPFGGEVLMALDDKGEYVGGVGIKRHDDAGHEIAVVTEPAARGQGLARRLVSQAARRILASGAVPTYLHDPANTASAKVAEASGFLDHGWTVLGMGERQP
jgi:RimJ/RimL family protein N-acetyltransferase